MPNGYTQVVGGQSRIMQTVREMFVSIFLPNLAPNHLHTLTGRRSAV